MNNEILKEMDLHDLARRYVNTFVRYDNQIRYLDAFVGNKQAIWTTKEGKFAGEFNPDLLDISRPKPRWVINNGFAYYLQYLTARQWQRGFSRNNCMIKMRGSRVNVLPGAMSFDLLCRFYTDPWVKVQTSTKALIESMQGLGMKSYLLSPCLLIHKQAGEGESISVYFREKYIGPFGRILPPFVQEIKELVGDYVNEDVIEVDRARVHADERKGKKARANQLAHLAEEVRDVRRNWVNFDQFDAAVPVPEDEPNL